MGFWRSAPCRPDRERDGVGPGDALPHVELAAVVFDAAKLEPELEGRNVFRNPHPDVAVDGVALVRPEPDDVA